MIRAMERACRKAVSRLRRVKPRSRAAQRELGAALIALGNHLQQRGRYAEAEPLFKEAIGLFELAFGVDHPEVATPLNQLAVCYKYLARFLEAGPLYQRACWAGCSTG